VLLRTTRPDDFPEVLEIHKLSGNSCAMLRVREASIVVLSTEFEGRPVRPPVIDARPVTRSERWGARAYGSAMNVGGRS
jgi:Lrp/AsnC family transcriptional regulator, leucine-responsive regulatory protein